MSERRGAALALGLVLAAGLVNYIDRVTLSVAGPVIAAELRLRPGQMGLLYSAFLWTYGLAQIPVGATIDRLGARPLLGGAMVLWSAAQGALGLAAGLPQLIAARLALGLGEAPQWPVGAKVVRAWFAPRAQGLATGVFNSASTLGPALAPPLVTALMLAFGWRGAFFATALAGLGMALVGLALYREPAAGPDAPTAPATPFRRLAASPVLWAMALGNVGSGYMNWFYAAWLPGYLESARHLSVPQTGWAGSIPYLFGFLGSLTGGVVCDRLAAAGFSPIGSRRAPVIAGLAIGGLFTGLAILAPTSGGAIAAISAALFCSNLAGAAIWALAITAAPPGGVAQVGATQNFGGFLGGALAPIVTGFTVEATHSFTAALATTAAAALGGALVYLLGVRRPIEV
ncbi:MAG TPA: MFS transporter [Caulobacteraceae bacterium]|nr:MFS transporter [Caulobacteraceae bacterium]